MSFSNRYTGAFGTAGSPPRLRMSWFMRGDKPDIRINKRWSVVWICVFLAGLAPAMAQAAIVIDPENTGWTDVTDDSSGSPVVSTNLLDLTARLTVGRVIDGGCPVSETARGLNL